MSLVVFDAGAYCQAMSSVYNIKLTCPEFWVDGDQLYQIRSDPSLEQYLSIYDSMPIKK
jgi:diaminopimelate decarboxylase